MLTYIFPFSRASADRYRSFFRFGVFNAVQSKCFDTVRTALATSLRRARG